MRSLAAVAILFLAVACAPEIEAPAQQADAVSACAAAEENIFSCPIGTQVASVCGSQSADGALALNYSGPGGAASTPEAGRYLSANGGVLQYLRFHAGDAAPVVFVSETRCGQQCWQRFEGVIVEHADGSREVLACDGEASFASEGDTQFSDAAGRANIAVDDGMGPHGMDGFPDIDAAQP